MRRHFRKSLPPNTEGDRITRVEVERIVAADKTIAPGSWVRRVSNENVESFESTVYNDLGYPLSFIVSWNTQYANRYSFCLLWAGQRIQGLCAGPVHKPHGRYHIHKWDDGVGIKATEPWPWPGLDPTQREIVLLRYLRFINIHYHGPFEWSRPQQTTLKGGMFLDEMLGLDDGD